MSIPLNSSTTLCWHSIPCNNPAMAATALAIFTTFNIVSSCHTQSLLVLSKPTFDYAIGDKSFRIRRNI
ncbi:hypothetical protein [Mucilaginibacter sp. SG564]|uniref:hypothetical protein n=1 Tax=Mucilaginibacter sp. SG564 TaxID=2587022 RepID=UPI0015575815|nr:hypothetical protein [Mucilaginibacter sp. SG564]NOW94979.1 hypothetical protein [Mucilaginibacter sp. SG564]